MGPGVFEPFSRDKLDRLLREFPVSAEGLAYINQALAKPSRNAQGTPFNLVSALPNAKMGFTLEAESKDVERRFVLQKTFDPNCLGFATQPGRIELLYQGRNGKRVRTPYTPDCIQFDLTRGVVVEEFKPAADRDRLEDIYPGRYYARSDGSYGSQAAQEVFTPMGIRFDLRFSDEIDEVGHRNRNFLSTYLQPAAERTYLALYPDLVEMLASRPQVGLEDLIDAGANRDVIHWALATQRLCFDIDAAPLATQAALVQIFRDEATWVAWRAAVRPDGSRPRPEDMRRCQALEVGDVVSLDGVRLTIRFIGHTGVLCRDDHGAAVDLTQIELEEALLAGKLVLPRHIGQPAVRSPLYSAGPAELARALRQARILEKIRLMVPLSTEEQHSARTVRRWVAKVKEGETKGWSAVESLIEISARGFHGPHFDSTKSMALDAAIVEGLKSKLAKTSLALYGVIETDWNNRGWRMVAKSTFYERVRKMKSPATVRESLGHKAAHQIEAAHWILEERTPIHAEHAMALVHIDSTLLDIELRSSLSGEVLGRPWLTLAICAHTRRVLGFHLSFRPPSYVSSMMVLADVIRRTGRLPDTIIHDWGSEFKAKDFRECLASLYIERQVRPKGSPRFGAVIERMFGITTQELIANLAGNTKLRKNVRSMSPGSDPSGHSGLWLLDLYVGLEDFFFTIYNGRKHPGTLRIPDQAFEASLISQGRRLHRLRRLVEILPVIAPMARGRTRVLDPARGLYVNYRHYSNPALAHHSLRDMELHVRPVPFDPGLILTFFRGEWLPCRAPLAPEVANAPEVVRRSLYEEWTIEQQFVNASADDARRKVSQLIEEMNQRALANQQYWSERKYHDILKTNVFPAGDVAALDGDKTTGTALEKLSASMRVAVVSAMTTGTFGNLVPA